MTALEPEATGFQLSPQQHALYRRYGGAARVSRRIPTDETMSVDDIVSRLSAMVAAHEALRTRYVGVAGLSAPVQVVDDPGGVVVEPLPRGGALVHAGAVTVERVPTAEGVDLVVELPRLSTDSASWELLVGTLTGAVDLPGEVLQYADVAVWLQEQLVDAKPGAETRSYLPFVTSGSGVAEVSPAIPATTVRRVKEIAEELAVAEAAVVLAAWESVYVRYTRTEGHRAAVVTDGRSAPGLGNLFGPLERPVPLPFELGQETSFADAVKAAHAALTEAKAAEYEFDPANVVGDTTAFTFRYRENGLAEPPDVLADLHVDCLSSPGGLQVAVAVKGAANEDLSSFAEAFVLLLADAVTDPARQIGVLGLAPQPKHAQEPVSRPETVLRSILKRADEQPDVSAVVADAAAVTYRDLVDRATSLAELLREHGVRPGALVPVIAEPAVETLVAMAGIWLAEAAFVPLDPSWPQARIDAVVRDVAASAIVTRGLSILDTGLRPEPATRAGAAYVIYTSGTSGTAKGVVIGHEQLAHYAAASGAVLRVGNGTRFAAMSTLAADLAYTAIFPVLAKGGSVHLIEPDVATDPAAFAERLRRNPVDAMKLVPSHLIALLAAGDDPAAVLPRETLVLGGEPLPLSLVDQVRALAPDLRVYNHYGPTETTIGASCRLVGTTRDERQRSVPVGTGIGGTSVTVVDSAGALLPPWCPGEILISGPTVGLGYLTGETGFADGRYQTGDVGRLVPGAGVETLGRLDDQVKLRGHRIRLGEVEGAVRRLSGVVAAAVTARGDENGLISHLDAYVVLDGNATAADLEERLRRELPPAWVPTRWQVVEQLPLTGNGKLDRDALTPIEPRRTRPTRPTDSVEQRLLVIWEEVVGVDGVSRDDDFFDLGGHSLHAIKLMARVNRAFGSNLPMASVLRARTVAATADLIREGRFHDSNLVPLRQGPATSPVFCFHPGGGTTLCYWDLARMLPAEHQVVGVEAIGLHGRPPHDDFAVMAEDYAAAIAAGAYGPPVLVGWCFGGLVARGTADALRRAGHDVALLVLVDCPAPGFDDTTDEALQEAQLLTESKLASRFAWHFEPELPSMPAETPTSYELMLKAMQTGGHLPEGTTEDEVKTIFDVYAANSRAWEEYAAEHVERRAEYPVLLVRAEADGAPADTDRTWGWGSLIGRDLQFASIAADHHSIMRQPAVAELASAITRTRNAK
ncbi:alpha/beta fold hydrolase [Amycolatopsis rubida]|uniref:Alpha/beta fold hydrolase n=1 Tax=Amycolatopsis rubida TaxID=112413 RepID=A0ABX0BJN1_9PSEU|nr:MULTISPECIES: AMP-binding protein [Amycolatopsis]MYW90733.1 AMP-binding protein [Amycolatopsis rubida]NEC55716.1 alpha/beta fold hydrolase [Amycolatopsis rubida]OAP19970.1 Tyrocidine synthase 3 [Amycolatopsis sp. M39]